MVKERDKRMVPVVKNFPRFDRSFFGAPEKLFEGWTAERFEGLAHEIAGGVSVLPEQGSDDFIFVPKGWLNRGGENESGNYWKVYFDDSSIKDMFLVPYGLNRVLFPYNVTVSFEDGVKFSNADLHYPQMDSGLRKMFDYPQGLLREAMDDVRLALPVALLVQGFAGYCVEDDMVPVSELKYADEQVKDLVDAGLPFPILLEALHALREALCEDVVYGRDNIIILAMKVYDLKVGV